MHVIAFLIAVHFASVQHPVVHQSLPHFSHGSAAGGGGGGTAGQLDFSLASGANTALIFAIP